MDDFEKEEIEIGITKTLDKHIGLVLDVASVVNGGTFFLCYGQWVSLGQCEEMCPKYSYCSNVAQVNMIGSEEYEDSLFEETKEW